MTPPLSEAQRMTEAERQELRVRVDALAALIKSYAPDDAYLAGEAKPLAHFLIKHWPKSQLSRQPEAAEVTAIRARHGVRALASVDTYQRHDFDVLCGLFEEEHEDAATLLRIVDAQARALSASERENVTIEVLSGDALMRVSKD